MKIVKCPYCDQLIKFDNLERGYDYHCQKCTSVVYKPGESNIFVSILSISTLILLYFVLTEPLLSVYIINDNSVTILESIVKLLRYDIFSGMILVVTIIVIPIAMILLTLAIIYHDRLGISTNILKKLIWSYIQIKEWNLIEVYFLGLLISMIKLVELSTMSILPGFWINCIYVVFLYMSVTMFNPYDILHIYKRKPLDRDSIKKSILLLGLAFIFIPASNILPIMPTYKYSVEYPNTILAGIEALYEDGDRAIAIIVFVASVCIPVIKILNVILMILMAQYNIFASYKMRVFMTKFYIFSDAWGKYSMLDVFVVVFASAFIQYDNLVRIEIGSAIIPFTLVVFFTMMASKVFDTRLLWKKR